jgi:hypothetical protein
MLTEIFPTSIYRGSLGVPNDKLDEFRKGALDAYAKYNPNGKPWSRSTRLSLEECDPQFAPLFDAVKRKTEAEFNVTVRSITGRELVQFKGDFVPPHVEASHLSAIYWVDCVARPNPAKAEYDGCLTLQSPIGPFGSKAMPGEKRTYMVAPNPDMLLIFPSHLLHFGHVYLGERPSVEVHFEMEIE